MDEFGSDWCTRLVILKWNIHVCNLCFPLLGASSYTLKDGRKIKVPSVMFL